MYEQTYVCNKIHITIFCKYAFKFATYENVFMFIQVCSFICLVGYVCLSIVEIVYFFYIKIYM